MRVGDKASRAPSQVRHAVSAGGRLVVSPVRTRTLLAQGRDRPAHRGGGVGGAGAGMANAIRRPGCQVPRPS